MEEINLLAVLIAVVANFFLGFVWYTPLFGKVWAREMGFDPNAKPTGAEMGKGMVLMIIGNFFLAYVFAHNLVAWSYVPGAAEMSVTTKILDATFFTWLGFYLPVDVGVVAWEKKSWKLFGINTSYHFVMLLVASTILTYM